MVKNPSLVIASTLTLVGTLVGCSSGKVAGNAIDTGSGGFGNGTGGASATTSGGATGGSSGNATTSGGLNGTGGAIAATGGRATGSTGGAIAGTGGRASGGSGGVAPGSGGLNGTGGVITATGGAPRNTGGAQNGTGGGTGAKATGGSGPATGGAPGNGGALGTGGTSLATGGKVATGGAGTGGATSVNPNVGAAINTCMKGLPYGGSTLSDAQRAPIITAIVNACSLFAPPGAQWQTWCQMFLVGAINAESSYNTQAGATGAAGDPSVGLLQIRFSSVVLDFANYGPVDALTSIGCNFGTVTSSDSYATKGSMMLDVNCNVAIGAWYYFIFASGNGGPSVVWVDRYCSGSGVAGNLHIGMASFLMGGDAAHQSLSGADYYVNEIKGWIEPCITYTGTHPFELPIQPDTSKYCR